ncbi:MAG: radical SAM protein [Sellimonas intestinalis]
MWCFQKASAVRDHVYGKKIYIRGLIEFTNYCKNDCYYCGIRRSAGGVPLPAFQGGDFELLRVGYAYGFRTFVLQGGEDPYFTEDRMEDLIRAVKSEFPDCALTLSVGEKSEKAYRKFREAGADRYLLRHETANREHYKRLHPSARDIRTQDELSCCFKTSGVSDRGRLYGWIALPDDRMFH